MAAPPSNLWAQAAAALSPSERLPIDIAQPNATQTISDILEVARQKQKECQEKRWNYKNAKGQVIYLRDVFGKVVKWIDTFKQIGDTISQYDPVHAALPWAGVRLLLQIAVNDSQTYGAMAEGVELVSDLITRYFVVEMFYLRKPSKTLAQLEKAILKLYSMVLIYLNKAIRYYEQSSLKRTTKSIVQAPQQSVEQYLTRLVAEQAHVDACTRLIDAEFHQQTHENVHQLVEGVADLNKRSDVFAMEQKKLESILRSTLKGLDGSQTKSERENIFRWLSCVPVHIHHRAKSRELLPGSCQWLYEKGAYLKWRESSVSSILWVHGIPGSGKSMLISSVIEKLHQKNSQNPDSPSLAYFYCARNSAEPERSHPDEIMRSILKQLSFSDADQTIRDPVVTAYREKEMEARGCGIEPLTHKETVEIILEILQDNSAVIIIDALDECNPALRQHLFLALSRLIEKSASLLKVLVSSRDDGDIVHRLTNSPNLYINACNNGKDIRDYVRTQISHAIEEERLLCGKVSELLREHIVSDLTSQAQGMFRLVSLHIETLCNPELVKTEDNVYYTMKRLPRALKDSYDLIFKQISNSQFPNPEMAYRVMKWLLCAQRQLSTSEFIAAISVDLSGQCFSVGRADVLSICCNLVVHDPEQDTFRFAHLSVREYLEGLPEYSSTTAHALALERCLIASLGLLNQSIDSWHLDKAILSYASYFWHKHYDHIHTVSGTVQLQNLQRILLDFFFYNHDKRPSFLLWMAMTGDTIGFSEGEQSVSALKRLVTKDLGSVRLRDESAASMPQRIDSVNVMLIDLLFGEKADKGRLGPALPLAVREGKDLLKVMLLKNGANVNVRDKHGKTALNYAIELKNEELLHEMLERHAIIGDRDNSGISDLCRASEIGNVLAVRLLVERGVPADIRNKDASTPLIAAATYSQIAVVQLLLEKGADVNATGYLYNTPLHRAAAKGNMAVSRLLLDSGANVNSTNLRERTPLHLAVEAGVEDLIQLLLERGAQISKKDMYGNLPVDVAAASGHATLVKVLLHMEEDPDKRHENARKALVKAFSEGKLEVVRFLMDSTVNPTECINLDELHKLATEPQSGTHNATLMFLLANWPNINALDNTGQTLLRRATKLGYSQLVSALLEQKVDTETQDFNGETVIQLAAREGEADIVRHLLDAKADINAATPITGYTALHGAAESGHLNIVKMLVSAGADVNAELSDGQTALHLAAAKDHEPVVAFLLDFM